MIEGTAGLHRSFKIILKQKQNSETENFQTKEKCVTIISNKILNKFKFKRISDLILQCIIDKNNSKMIFKNSVLINIFNNLTQIWVLKYNTVINITMKIKRGF